MTNTVKAQVEGHNVFISVSFCALHLLRIVTITIYSPTLRKVSLMIAQTCTVHLLLLKVPDIHIQLPAYLPLLVTLVALEARWRHMVASQVVARECTLEVCVFVFVHVFKGKQENPKVHAVTVSDNYRLSLSVVLLFIYPLVLYLFSHPLHFCVLLLTKLHQLLQCGHCNIYKCRLLRHIYCNHCNAYEIQPPY